MNPNDDWVLVANEEDGEFVPAPELVSVSATELVLVSVSATELVQVSVPAPEPDVVSVPATEPVLVSVPATELVLVSVPATEPDLDSVPAPEPDLVSVPAPEPDLVSVHAHKDFLNILILIFGGISPENLVLVSKDNSRDFYDNVKCPETIVNDIANELLHYSRTHTTLFMSPDKPFKIVNPFFHSTHETMTLLAVLLILHKQMEEAYKVLMLVSGTGRSDKLVTALVLHMCEQEMGINDPEMLSACRTQRVPENVMNFANAMLHRK